MSTLQKPARSQCGGTKVGYSSLLSDKECSPCAYYCVLLLCATVIVGCTGGKAPAPPPIAPLAAPAKSQSVGESSSQKVTSSSTEETTTSPSATSVDSTKSAPKDSTESAKVAMDRSEGENAASLAKSPATEPGKGNFEPNGVSPDSTAGTAAASLANGPEKEPPSLHEDVNLFGREQILLLLPDGPVIVALRLSIDGRSHVMAFDNVVDDVLKQTDVDGDGKSTWDEVVSSPRFRYGQAGNLEAKDAGARQRLIQLYDSNRDGIVDRDELPRFITRNAGGSRSFSWSSSNLYRGLNRSQSPVRRWLDSDGDGALSHEELDAAAVRLRSRDGDDDDVLAMADFKLILDANEGQLPNRRRISETDSAFALGSRTKWDGIEYALREHRGVGFKSGFNELGFSQEVTDYLDEDQNGKVEKVEIARLATAPADLVLIICFGNKGEGVQQSLELRVASRHVASQIERTTTFGQRISVQLPKAKIEFFVNDQAEGGAVVAQVDSLFARYDGDSNGYLDEKEYPAQELPYAPELKEMDENDDQKIYPDELKAYLTRRLAPARSQVRARAADAEDAFFAALDEDGDGRLNAREISRAGQRLRKFDQNTDGQIHSFELPECMIVGLVRGEAEREAALFVPPTSETKLTQEKLPSWFGPMDTNGDGEVSSQEFLGETVRFSELDQNSDGFLAASEVSKP